VARWRRYVPPKRRVRWYSSKSPLWKPQPQILHFSLPLWASFMLIADISSVVNMKGYIGNVLLRVVGHTQGMTRRLVRLSIVLSLLFLFWNKKFWEELVAYFPWCDKGHIENHASNNSSIVACVFVTAVTFLRSRCVATISGFLLPSRCLSTIGFFFTKPLPSNDKGMFAEPLASNDKGDKQTHTRKAAWSHKPTLFFQNREVG
jgi:hypothetical protein